jgi:hypothetical protein
MHNLRVQRYRTLISRLPEAGLAGRRVTKAGTARALDGRHFGWLVLSHAALRTRYLGPLVLMTWRKKQACALSGTAVTGAQGGSDNVATAEL